MPARVAKLSVYPRGFVYTQPKTSGVRGSVIDGQNTWIWANGLIRSSKGTASAGSSGGANPLMNVGNGHGGVTGGGTVTRAFGNPWAAGSGTALENGGSLGTVSGALRLGNPLVNAGIAQPTAPVLSDSGVAGIANGSYSVVITAIRSSTGAESTRSLPSNVVSVTNKKIRITFPAVPAGADKWGIYCSFRNFGATGPWFHLEDVNTGPASIDRDWFNGQLGVEAPIDHDVPPNCTHCFAINSCMVAAGTFSGGSGLSPSIPGSPEAFPPDFTVFIPGGGSITSCKATGFEGSVLVATASSLNGVIGTNNADVSPIMCRQIWPTTGFATGNAWCTVEGEVYGFSGQRGAVRTRGDGPPDTSFAADVATFFEDNGYTASNTVVGYDPKTDSIVYASGIVALPFYRTGEWWHTKMILPGSAVTSVTLNGRLLIDVGGGTLVEFEAGGGTSWNVVSAFDDFDRPRYIKNVVRARVASNVTVQLDILGDGDTSTSLSGPLSCTAPDSVWHHLNIRNIETVSVKLSGTGSGNSVYETELEAVPHMVTRGS